MLTWGTLIAYIAALIAIIKDFRIAAYPIAVIYSTYLILNMFRHWSIVIHKFLLINNDDAIFLNEINAFFANNKTTIHVIGAAITIATIVRLLSSNVVRVRFNLLKKALTAKASSLSDNFEDMFQIDEVQNRLINFSRDANHLAIFSGDADFLRSNDRQHAELKRFGPNCKILMKTNHAVPKNDLKLLMDNGLQIRTYNHNGIQNTSLRGRLKISPEGMGACLFDKNNSGYRLIELKNQTLVNMLHEKYDDIFYKSLNPVVKHISFDLAGVYFKGDIKNFFASANEILGHDIEHIPNNYLCVDENLNLGEIGIVDYIKMRSKNTTITKIQEDKIIDAWTNTWSFDQEMFELVKQIKGMGYNVSCASNCDSENLKHFDLRQLLEIFDQRFLSLELKILKPNPQFYKRMFQDLNLEPYECVIIDDHRENIFIAKNLGANTIKVNDNSSSESKVKSIKSGLISIGIPLE